MCGIAYMEIDAVISTLKTYAPTFEQPELQIYDIDELQDLSRLGKQFLLDIGSSRYAVSRWTGPKRTRTYPFESVYNTIHHQPRVTLIPYVKDEGKAGNRDFLQAATFSWMTLLNVYVIITYHVSAIRNGEFKVTKHQIDHAYVQERLRELAAYSGDSYHWNTREIKEYLPQVGERVLHYHDLIEKTTGVPLKSKEALEKHIENDRHNFSLASTQRAKAAQGREQIVVHQHERAAMGRKAAINIQNFYNGVYHLTVDEAIPHRDALFLIEKKHTTTGVLPAIGDMKDAILNLIVFRNIDSVDIDGQIYAPRVVLGLTSNKIKGYCHNQMAEDEIDAFFDNCNLRPAARRKLKALFHEANTNAFFAYVVNADEEPTVKPSILEDFYRQ